MIICWYNSTITISKSAKKTPKLFYAFHNHDGGMHHKLMILSKLTCNLARIHYRGGSGKVAGLWGLYF